MTKVCKSAHHLCFCSSAYSRLFALLLLSIASFSLAAEKCQQDLCRLTLITEEYPPYNFQTEQGLSGIAVDLLTAAYAKTDNPLNQDDILLLPWARGYRSALNLQNVVLFSTTRTEARENQFKWAGPIARTRVVLMARRDRQLNIDGPYGYAKYIIGGIRDDVGLQLFRQLQTPAKQIMPAANANSMARMLAAGRIDIWAYEENVARYFLQRNGLSPADYEVLKVLEEGQLYYAFSRNTDDSLVDALQQAIDAVKQDSISDYSYQQMLRKYAIE